MIEVALFPIPGSVNFPGVSCPLHVFEPRYRKMVRHCLDEGLPMGVCHTEKILRAATGTQSREEALNSNQSTYKPCEVFSAGPVTLLEELEDGRLLIEVEMDTRLKLHSEIQTLPFGIWSCDPFPDEPMDSDGELRVQQAQQKVLQRLLTLTHSNAAAQDMLNSDNWQNMTALEFSFSVFGLLGLDPDLKQQMLEVASPLGRLEQVLQLLNEIH